MCVWRASAIKIQLRVKNDSFRWEFCVMLFIWQKCPNIIRKKSPVIDPNNHCRPYIFNQAIKVICLLPYAKKYLQFMLAPNRLILWNKWTFSKMAQRWYITSWLKWKKLELCMPIESMEREFDSCQECFTIKFAPYKSTIFLTKTIYKPHR